jgi:hypothetical protein
MSETFLCNKPEGHEFRYMNDKEAFGMWGCPVWECKNCGRREDVRDECEHGSLRRSCEICQLQARVAELEAQLALARAFLKAHDVMADMADRGQDDSGKRDTPSYRDWMAADCRYQEAVDAFRKAAEDRT